MQPKNEKNSSKKIGLSNEQIMNIAEVPLDFVLNIRAELPDGGEIRSL